MKKTVRVICVALLSVLMVLAAVSCNQDLQQQLDEANNKIEQLEAACYTSIKVDSDFDAQFKANLAVNPTDGSITISGPTGTTVLVGQILPVTTKDVDSYYRYYQLSSDSKIVWNETSGCYELSTSSANKVVAYDFKNGTTGTPVETDALTFTNLKDFSVMLVKEVKGEDGQVTAVATNRHVITIDDSENINVYTAWKDGKDFYDAISKDYSKILEVSFDNNKTTYKALATVEGLTVTTKDGVELETPVAVKQGDEFVLVNGSDKALVFDYTATVTVADSKETITCAYGTVTYSQVAAPDMTSELVSKYFLGGYELKIVANEGLTVMSKVDDGDFAKESVLKGSFNTEVPVNYYAYAFDANSTTALYSAIATTKVDGSTPYITTEYASTAETMRDIISESGKENAITVFQKNVDWTANTKIPATLYVSTGAINSSYSDFGIFGSDRPVKQATSDREGFDQYSFTYVVKEDKENPVLHVQFTDDAVKADSTTLRLVFETTKATVIAENTFKVNGTGTDCPQIAMNIALNPEYEKIVKNNTFTITFTGDDCGLFYDQTSGVNLFLEIGEYVDGVYETRVIVPVPAEYSNFDGEDISSLKADVPYTFTIPTGDWTEAISSRRLVIRAELENKAHSCFIRTESEKFAYKEGIYSEDLILDVYCDENTKTLNDGSKIYINLAEKYDVNPYIGNPAWIGLALVHEDGTNEETAVDCTFTAKTSDKVKSAKSNEHHLVYVDQLEKSYTLTLADLPDKKVRDIKIEVIVLTEDGNEIAYKETRATYSAVSGVPTPTAITSDLNEHFGANHANDNFNVNVEFSEDGFYSGKLYISFTKEDGGATKNDYIVIKNGIVYPKNEAGEYVISATSAADLKGLTLGNIDHDESNVTVTFRYEEEPKDSTVKAISIGYLVNFVHHTSCIAMIGTGASEDATDTVYFSTLNAALNYCKNNSVSGPITLLNDVVDEAINIDFDVTINGTSHVNGVDECHTIIPTNGYIGCHKDAESTTPKITIENAKIEGNVIASYVNLSLDGCTVTENVNVPYSVISASNSTVVISESTVEGNIEEGRRIVSNTNGTLTIESSTIDAENFIAGTTTIPTIHAYICPVTITGSSSTGNCIVKGNILADQNSDVTIGVSGETDSYCTVTGMIKLTEYSDLTVYNGTSDCGSKIGSIDASKSVVTINNYCDVAGTIEVSEGTTLTISGKGKVGTGYFYNTVNGGIVVTDCKGNVSISNTKIVPAANSSSPIATGISISATDLNLALNLTDVVINATNAIKASDSKDYQLTVNVSGANGSYTTEKLFNGSNDTQTSLYATLVITEGTFNVNPSKFVATDTHRVSNDTSAKTYTVYNEKPFTGIQLSPSTASLTVGGTKTLTVLTTSTETNYKAVIWSSSNTSVATVSSDGKVTAVAAGSATITATSTDDINIPSATCSVTVTKAN